MDSAPPLARGIIYLPVAAYNPEILVLNASFADAGKRLDVFLQERLPDYSRSRLQERIKAGWVSVNGAIGRASSRLHGGEAIKVEPAELPRLHAFAEDIPLKILYEDPDVIAVDKPAGMVVHAGGMPLGNVSQRAAASFRHALRGRRSGASRHRPPARPFHKRVILVARTDAAHRNLAAQFATRRIEKIYLTLVHGSVKQDQGRIES